MPDRQNLTPLIFRALAALALAALWVAMPLIISGAAALGLLWAIMVLGVFITYRILNIADLTVEGTIVLGASLFARLTTSGVPPFAATLAAFFAGLAAGLISGLLHTKLRIPALLSGILTLTGLYSINLRIMGGPNVPLLPFKVPNVFTPFERFGLPSNVPALIVGGVCLAVIIAALYWFFGTELGSAIRATGSNPAMVRAQGVNTSGMIILGLMLSNGLVGLSGALIAQHQTFADINMGMGSIVIGLASLIIGEVLFGTKTFRNTLIAVVCGAVAYRVIIALVIQMGLAANDLKLFVALTVTLALTLPQLRAYRAALSRSLRRPPKEVDGNA